MIENVDNFEVEWNDTQCTVRFLDIVGAPTEYVFSKQDATSVSNAIAYAIARMGPSS